MTLLLPVAAFPQHKHKQAKFNQAVEDSIFRKHFECFYMPAYTNVQRKSFYPFNIAAKIEVIKCMAPEDQLIEDGDTAATNEAQKPLYIKVADGSYKINRKRIFQSIILTKGGIDSLTNILYNYGYTPVRKTKSNLIDEPTGCYQPRNAILFIGEDGKVKEWMEYCFTCLGYRHSSDKIKNYDFCNQKYEMLRKFFFDRELTPLTHLGY